MADRHALKDLIGIPFALRGRGPECFDCYGLLSHIYARDGKQIPNLRSPLNGAQITAVFAIELTRWHRVEPRAGVAVVMRVPGNMHCGYMISEDEMIHTWEQSGGVVIEPIEEWRRRIVGFYDYT